MHLPSTTEGSAHGFGSRSGFLPGNPGSVDIRKPLTRLRRTIGAQFAQPPDALMLAHAAKSLNVEVSELPLLATIEALWVYVFTVFALRGSPDHSKELLGRLSPMPSRAAGNVSVTVNTTRTAAVMAGVDEDAARDYMESLTIEIPRGDDDADDDDLQELY